MHRGFAGRGLENLIFPDEARSHGLSIKLCRILLVFHGGRSRASGHLRAIHREITEHGGARTAPSDLVARRWRNEPRGCRVLDGPAGTGPRPVDLE